MMAQSKYKFSITLWKGVRRLLQFGLPLMFGYFVNFHPEITSLTVGGLVEMLINWLKNKDK